MESQHLKLKPIGLLMLLSLVWGANMAFVKFALTDITPLFMCGIRSLVASICLFWWMKAKGLKIFPTRFMALHGLVVGLLFGGEFAAIYVALKLTTASATYILLYTAPFFAALGAHILIKEDKLSTFKVIGLIVAFVGVSGLFLRSLNQGYHSLSGDIFALAAGFMWGMTSVYVKKFLAIKTTAKHVLFYQLSFSVPFLFLMSFIFEEGYIMGFSKMTFYSLIYQSIIVAFLSYLAWFELIDRYPVSILHAFSFFTPVFGVLISGLIMLKEPIGPNIMFALTMVTIGSIIANQKRNS